MTSHSRSETVGDPQSIDEGDAATGMRSLPYELRIGVTGHRVLSDPEAVKDAVRNLLNKLVSIFAEASRDPRGPHGSPHSAVQRVDDGLTLLLSWVSRALCPVINVILRCFRMSAWPIVPVAVSKPTTSQQTPLKLTAISSLASGSDQIVTDVVHEMLQQPTEPCLVPAAKRNRYVEAVLPLPVGEYEQSFSTGGDLHNFRRLLSLDHGQFSRRPEPTIVSPADTDGQPCDQTARHIAYATAGRYVVDTSEIIVAIWDPEHAEQPGGTAETIRYALRQTKTVIWLNPNSLQQGAQLLRGASNAPLSTSSHSDLSLLAGVQACELPTRAKELSPGFHRLAAFNRDNAISTDEFAAAFAEESSRFEIQSKGKLPTEVSRTIAAHVLPIVVRADQLSLRYQALRGVALSLWPNLAAFAVTLMGLQILFLPNQYWLAWVELGVLLTCAIAHRVSVHEAWHDKWRNDRRLAEGLRSALFSSLVAKNDANSGDGSSYSVCGESRWRIANPLPFYNAGQSWFVATLKRIASKEQNRFSHAIKWDRDLNGTRTFLSEEWIERQADYHARYARGHERLAKRSNIMRLSTMGLIMMVAVLHGLGVGHEREHHDGVAAITRIDLWIGWATLVLPAWAAALHAFSSTQDHERLAERSHRMVPLLAGIAQRIRDAQSRSEVEAAVREAEQLFDLENQEWSESLAERKPEFSG